MKVALVEFLNAYPLYYAIKHGIIQNDFTFIPRPPSICASLLRNGSVDISNAPIVEYTKSDSYKIVGNVCISGHTRVKSVILILKRPLNKVKVVKLDRNSNTSVALTKLLFIHKYKMNVSFTYDNNDVDCELVIGDNALQKLKNMHYEILDLAYEWKEMVGYDFVFAVWITNKHMDPEIKKLFIKSKEWGISHIDLICQDFVSKTNLLSFEECRDYLSKNISYHLTDDKIHSIEIFLQLAKQYNIIYNNRKIVFT